MKNPLAVRCVAESCVAADRSKQHRPAARARSAAAALFGSLLLYASPAARAEVIDIAWQDGDRYARELTVAAGRFAELCGPLDAGKRVDWSFEADGALNFNIHYHLGKEVHYPTRSEQVRRSEGSLAVEQTQDYCWMWTNKSSAPARLSIRLARQ